MHAAPNVDLERLPIGSTLKASDYTVLLAGDQVDWATYDVGQMRGGSGGSIGLLELALDGTGTSAMAKWAHDHPRSAIAVLVDGRLLAQPVPAKHVASGRVALVGTDVTTMGRLVASAIRTRR